MIESKVPKDIDKYKTKTIGPFTTRQTIFIAIMALLDFLIIVLFLQRTNMEPTDWLYVLVPIDAPLAIVGFVDVYGVPLEKYIIDYVRFSILAPTKRIEKTVIYKEEGSTNGKKSKNKNSKKKKNKAVPKAEFKPYD